MSTYWYGNTISSHWRAYAFYNTSSTNTDYTITVSGGFQSIGWGYDLSGVSCKVEIGSYSKTGSGNVSTSTGESKNVRLVSDLSHTYSRTHSAQTITLKTTINRSGASYHAGTSTGSTTITIPAKPSYTVSFNANGGSGAPAAQTKWYGETLTISSTKPTRTGYTFKGWATSASSTTVSYASGASYTGNAALTLYAVWQKVTYAVTYNGNGSTGGSTAAQTKEYGTALTLRNNGFTKTNYNFVKWNTKADGTGTSYAAGASYTGNAALTLYAIWAVAYASPTISDLVVVRNDGTNDDDEGTSMRVAFSWSVDSDDNGAVSSITIKHKLSTSSSWTSVSVSGASGSSGTVNEILSGPFNQAYSYDVQVVVSDTHGLSKTMTTLLSTSTYVFDVWHEGNGIAFGKPATGPGMEIDWNTKINGHVYLPNAKNIYGKNTDGDVVSSFEPCNASGGTIVGYGSYAISKGYTNIYGNSSIGLATRGNINLNGAQRSNKYNAVLWSGGSGGYYMTSSQSVTLSENVSAQAHGIVLAWSAYSSSTAQNYGWNYTFIPKSHVNDHPGAGISCMLIDPDRIGMKYVYVSNNKITGNDRNDDNGNVSGTNNVKFSNNYWVLRAVYGV